jgi:hypothetical protein
MQQKNDMFGIAVLISAAVLIGAMVWIRSYLLKKAEKARIRMAEKLKSEEMARHEIQMLVQHLKDKQVSVIFRAKDGSLNDDVAEFEQAVIRFLIQNGIDVVHISTKAGNRAFTDESQLPTADIVVIGTFHEKYNYHDWIGRSIHFRAVDIQKKTVICAGTLTSKDCIEEIAKKVVVILAMAVNVHNGKMSKQH